MNRERAAYNGRFGASGAVARPKVCVDLEVLFPSERQWKPRQAAGTLVASGGQRNRKRQKVNATIVLKEQNKENICLKSVAENPKNIA